MVGAAFDATSPKFDNVIGKSERGSGGAGWFRMFFRVTLWAVSHLLVLLGRQGPSSARKLMALRRTYSAYTTQ